jgi:hypothetical protein
MRDRMSDIAPPIARDPAADAVDDQPRIDAIVATGPSGAFAVAGLATAVVIAIWLAFYFFAYLPRGAMQ